MSIFFMKDDIFLLYFLSFFIHHHDSKNKRKLNEKCQMRKERRFLVTVQRNSKKLKDGKSNKTLFIPS